MEDLASSVSCLDAALGIFKGTGRLPTPATLNAARLSAAGQTEGTGRVEGLFEVQCALLSAHNNKDVEKIWKQASFKHT